MLMRSLQVLVATFAWCSCNGSPIEDVAACANSVATDVRGIVALDAQCPGLESALHQLGVIEVLQPKWQATLNTAALRDIVELMDDHVDTAVVSPDVTSLKGILEQIAQEQPEASHSWWDSFTKWLRSWLSSREVQSIPWLDKWLKKLASSADLITQLTYFFAGGMLLVAIWFFIRELRAVGIIGGKSSPPAVRGTPGFIVDAEHILTIANVEQASLAEKPSLLLQLLVAHLFASGQLKMQRCLTHRELSLHARFADNHDRECFVQVTRIAEELMYGRSVISTERIVGAVSAGIELARRLPQGTANQ